MSDITPEKQTDLDDLLANDTGSREIHGKVAKLITITAIIWSVLQVYYASRWPFELQAWLNHLGFNNMQVVINSTDMRKIHLAFALFLAFLSYSICKKSSRNNKVPWFDWCLAIVGVFVVLYGLFFKEQLIGRVGAINTQDMVVGCIGLLILLEATRRALGLPLVIIAAIFLIYSFAGHYLPHDWMLALGKISLTSIVNQQWITTEGVFGVALDVSAKYVFPFVLFGAMLDKAGAGNYFIKTAFAYLGHFKGGPAKAAVVSSGLTGLISGSSIANVVTTGTFTIPMMKRVGFSAEKAGAVEVASSVNGQIMPPVMGAAAFLMVEYVNMDYHELIKHAFLPATISYIALVYIVHLEACKANMRGLERTDAKVPFEITLLRIAIFIALVVGLFMGIYELLSIIKTTIPKFAGWAVCTGLVCTYLAAIYRVSRFPDLVMDDPQQTVVKLPSVKPTVNSGLHFLLPVIVLIWFLMIEKSSAGLSAYYGVVTLAVIQITQRPLLVFFRKKGDWFSALKQGFYDLKDSLEAGARNMIGIGIATACAGIIVGAVAQTSLGSRLSDVIEALAFGQIVLILFWVAIFSLILGMGLPTTANYIVVSSLMAGVIVELGRQNGLIVPLIAVHLFVFYFGIMADVTPPVGLASFAAAAISGGDPMKTGLVAFWYSLRTALLPFLFIFNTDLLLLNVNFFHGVLIFVIATLAMLAFTAATMGWFFDRNRIWETALLLLVTAMLFRPGYFMNYLSPSVFEVTPQMLVSELGKARVGDALVLKIDGMNDYGEEIQFYAPLIVPEGKDGQDRMKALGITLVEKDGKQMIDDVRHDSPAKKEGLDWDQIILSATLSRDNAWAKEWIYIPGVGLLALLAWWQIRRKKTVLPDPEMINA